VIGPDLRRFRLDREETSRRRRNRYQQDQNDNDLDCLIVGIHVSFLSEKI
jgi:hypothetical protein